MEGGPRPDPRRTGQLCGVAQSAAVNRRSRCGSVRSLPVPSSHFRPGAAPQVGQRTCRRRMMPRLGVLCYEERNTTIFLWPSCCSRASIARPGGERTDEATEGQTLRAGDFQERLAGRVAIGRPDPESHGRTGERAGTTRWKGARVLCVAGNIQAAAPRMAESRGHRRHLRGHSRASIFCDSLTALNFRKALTPKVKPIPTNMQ